MKNKKGFTLTELAVAMAISAIAISMLVVIFTSIDSFTKNKEFNSNLQNEIFNFKNEISKIIEPCQSSAFTLETFTGQSNELTFNGEKNVTIKFENNVLYKNNSKIMKFEIISGVNFELNENIIKCNLSYGDNKNYIFIMEKRV